VPSTEPSAERRNLAFRVARLTGIRVRHSRNCRSAHGGRCNCRPTYEASVGAGVGGEKLRRQFKTQAAARAWQAEVRVLVDRGQLRAGLATSLNEAADELETGMRDGTIRTRSGDPYKPSVIRSYEQALRLHIRPDLGGLKLRSIRRRDVQVLADRMVAAGADASTVRNALMPLRVIYRRAIEAGDVAVSPVQALRLPAVRGRRDRIAAPGEAAELISALRLDDQALWGSAFYAGLRMGELRALRWSDVDMAAGVIRVERALDHKGTTITPKSEAGRRSVPIPKTLRTLLAAHRLQQVGEGYVFGSSLTTPFTPSAVHRRARLRWQKHDPPLEKIGLHEARHTFASIAIAAGVNAKALSAYMGHSSITITLDRYGHLMPGNEEQAASLLDAYLERHA
jgi:integrase